MPPHTPHTSTYRDTHEARTAARHYAWGHHDHPDAAERFATLYTRAWHDHHHRVIGICPTIPDAHTNWATHGGAFNRHDCQRCGIGGTRRYTPAAIPRITPRQKFVPLAPHLAHHDFPTGQPTLDHDPTRRLCLRCEQAGHDPRNYVDTTTHRSTPRLLAGQFTLVWTPEQVDDLLHLLCTTCSTDLTTVTPQDDLHDLVTIATQHTCPTTPVTGTNPHHGHTSNT